MTEFLTTQGTSYQIENIIRTAKQELTLISPFLKLSQNLIERLRDADKRQVKIILIYGKDELSPEERAKLQLLENLNLYFCENLHAKCYFNEECMVITSMNIYEYSEKNNREMGILLHASDDKKIFEQALQEVKSVLNASVRDDTNRHQITKSSSHVQEKCHCIRCGTNIRCDLNKPLCGNCFNEWSMWENPDYEEYYCHVCGKSEPTTIEKPLCYSCYTKLKK